VSGAETSLRLKVLVTGAGGFIGSAVCRALVAQGHFVHAGFRRTPSLAESGPGPRIVPRPLDLDQPDQVRAAVAGMDAIVHAAYGRLEAMPDQLARLTDAAEAADVRRFVHFSSIAVYGAATGEVNEAHPPVPPIDAYGAAKIRCEEQLMAWARPGRVVTALRPGIVYGPHSPFWNDKIERRIRVGAWGTFGPAGEGTAALVHVADVAAGVAAALRRAPEPAWLQLNLTGPQCPTWNTYFSALAAALGVELRALTAPELSRMRALAPFAKVWRRLGLPGLQRWALAPGRGELALFARHAVYPSDRARELLGWAPTRDFRVELQAIHGGRSGPRPIRRSL